MSGRYAKPTRCRKFPADLPREERVIDVPEDQRQGMKLIGGGG
jgi:hypothetical protein